MTVNGQSTATFQPKPVAQHEDDRRRAVGIEHVRPRGRRVGEPHAGRRDEQRGRDAVLRQLDERQQDARRLRRRAGRLARSVVPDGRTALRPEQRVRHEVPERRVSEGQRRRTSCRTSRGSRTCRFLDQFRSRARVRRVGRAAGTDGRDSISLGDVDATSRPIDQPGVVLASLGNQDLRPERATEFEGGFDSRWLGSRVNLDLTYYSKITKDALVGAVIPPDLGTGNTTQRTNLGSVKNAGLEGLLSAQVIDRRNVGVDLTFSGSANANKLLTLGVDAQGRPLPPQVGTTTRNQPGYPLFGYWQRRYTYADANNDGMITRQRAHRRRLDDVHRATRRRDSRRRCRPASISSSTSCASPGSFDHKSGYSLLNGTERIRCQSRNNCFGTYSQGRAALDAGARRRRAREQRQHAVRLHGERHVHALPRADGDVDAAAVGSSTKTSFAKEASIVFSARNLHKWTKYTGIDPESDSDAGSTISTQTDFQAAPPPTYFIFRLNVVF